MGFVSLVFQKLQFEERFAKAR